MRGTLDVTGRSEQESEFRPSIFEGLQKGAAVEAIGFGAAQVIRLASNLALTRLLFPEAFGLMAIISLVLFGLVMLTDIGLLQAVVRSEHGDRPEFLDTVWSIQVVRGALLWVAAALLAWPISILFREPVLFPMIMVGSASAFIQALGSSRLLTLRRKLRPGPLVTLELTSQVVGSATMIALAYFGVGVWSLVIGTIVGTAIHTAFSYAMPGTHREQFHFDEAARHEVVRFGRWIFASSAVTFAAARGDQVVLGRALGATTLGNYNVALALAEAPEALAHRIITGILYPLYARIQNDHPARFGRVYYRTRLAFDGIAQGGLGILIGAAPWLIHLLFDQRYAAAVPILQILALRSSIGLVASPAEVALIAFGQSKLGFHRNVTVAVTTLLAMAAALYSGAGLVGLLWAAALARGSALFVLWPAMNARGILRISQELLVVPLLLGGYAVGRATTWLLLGQ
jgi:O-antigen/teichoic acid export membrane protein